MRNRLPSASWVLCCVGLCAVGMLVFGQTLWHALLRWDDAMHILENPYLYPPLNLKKFIDLWRYPYFGLYIPMTYTMWGLIKMGTADPVFFHGLNVILHLLNGLLIVRLFSRIGLSLVPAILGACFFLLHPLVVEPVAWISGLKDVGSMFFGLLAVTFFLGKRPTIYVRYSLSLVFYIFAVMTKPSGVVFALIASILSLRSWTETLGGVASSKSQDGTQIDLEQSKTMLTGFSGFLSHPSIHALCGALLASPMILISIYLQPAVRIQEYVVWWKRPLVALDAISFYVWKFLWPRELLPDYAHLPSMILKDPSVWSLGVGVCTILCGVWLLLKKSVYGIGIGMMLAGLLPNLGLVPFAFQDHSTVADRYAYVALAGGSLLISLLASRGGLRWLVAGFVPLLAFLSYQQIGHWKDQVSLFEYVLAANPRSVVALDGLGTDAYRRGDIVQAEELFRRALAINSRDPRAWFNIGSTLWLKGDGRGAREALETSLKLDPNHPDTLNNLGFVYASSGADEAAESLFRRALYVSRLDLDARYNLAQIMEKKGLITEAAKLIDEAVGIHPGFKEKYLLGHH